MKKILSLIIITAYILKFNNITYANEIYKIYYIDNTFEERLDYKEYTILKEFDLEKNIYLLLETFCINSKKLNNLPYGTKILSTNICDNSLYINFNESIENYGGNSYEANILRQILHTCFQFEEIDNVTFLIDGEYKILPEGHLVYKYTREDMELIDYNYNLTIKEIYFSKF